MEKRNYNGFIRDKPDDRDLIFRAPKKTELPPSVNLIPYCSEIEDQGQLGSCTSQSIVGMLEYLENRKNGSYKNLSRLFQYYNTRKIQGTINEDSGSSLRDSCKSAVKYGICRESLWGYNIRKFKSKPYIFCYLDGELHKADAYYRITTLQDMKQALADGYVFVIGIAIYESFETEAVESTGTVPMPKKGEELLGYHAIDIVGYTPDYFLFRNSWGPDWGNKGYGTLPIAFLDPKNGLAEDAWFMKVGIFD
jgi:C1A family cysteine protease